LDETLRIIAVWVHILGIALFVGPQFFLAFAWPPASRLITDARVRVRVMRTITRRFGYLGGVGLVLIIVAGTYLISTWRDYYGIPDDTGFTEIRYGVVFIVKMTLLIVLLAVTAAHAFIVGPKLSDLLEAQAEGERFQDDAVRSMRLRSMALSITGLVTALAMMVMGTMLATPAFSLQ
jgi:uncharacterized membrane protein